MRPNTSRPQSSEIMCRMERPLYLSQKYPVKECQYCSCVVWSVDYLQLTIQWVGTAFKYLYLSWSIKVNKVYTIYNLHVVVLSPLTTREFWVQGPTFSIFLQKFILSFWPSIRTLIMCWFTALCLMIEQNIFWSLSPDIFLDPPCFLLNFLDLKLSSSVGVSWPLIEAFQFW